MSFFDDASLAFLPSSGAGKDRKAYSIKPTDGTGDFTFSRGSNLAATRVGPTGLIEKGRENLFTYSNQFDTTWATTNSSVTSGQSGYDGSNDAWKLEATAASTAFVRQFIDTSSSVSTFSFYAKAGTANWTYVNCVSVTAFFNLSNGTTGYVNSNAIDASITSVGGGWYRVSLTGTGMTQQRIYTAPANNNSISAIGDNIYIQDAQLELGLAATEVITSGATTGKAGLLEDEPRFDYSGGATCPSLLLEPSRTNILRQTEYFDSSSWTNDAGTTLTTNAAISPDGSQNATRFESPLSSKGLFTYGAVNNQTISIYIKAGNADNIGKSVNLFTTTINQGFVLTDEWQRISVSGGASNLFALYPSSGDGINAFIWGAQAEAASYPTSYIPNHSGGSVTRADDDISVSSLQSNNIVEATDSYTIFFDISNDGGGSTAQAGNSQWLKGANSTLGNIWTLRKNDSTNQKEHSLYFNQGTEFVFTNENIDKACFVFTSNQIKIFINGSVITTYNASVSPLDLDKVIVTYGSANRTSIVFSQLLLFPTALSDADCITLTT